MEGKFCRTGKKFRKKRERAFCPFPLFSQQCTDRVYDAVLVCFWQAGDRGHQFRGYALACVVDYIEQERVCGNAQNICDSDKSFQLRCLHAAFNHADMVAALILAPIACKSIVTPPPRMICNSAIIILSVKSPIQQPQERTLILKERIYKKDGTIMALV